MILAQEGLITSFGEPTLTKIGSVLESETPLEELGGAAWRCCLSISSLKIENKGF
jgi:hypothetical protein